MRGLILFWGLILAVVVGDSRASTADDLPSLNGVRRVVFLGDSITYSGQYVEAIETFLRSRDPMIHREYLDLGLPSETVSGLSEPGHAGGQFPRPALEERLDRVLEKARPELVVVCYGMNDGIYHPYSDERFRAFQDGMKTLRAKAQAAGARVVHVTPPVFDPLPIQSKTLPAGSPEYRLPYAGYDEVLSLYSAWLLAQRGNGWNVVDIHGPMDQFLRRQRLRDPKFRLANDGVHLDDTGHWLIARQILEHWGVPKVDLGELSPGEAMPTARPNDLALLKLVQRKQRLLKDSWLTETGHRRPGMKKGMPLAEAEAQAAQVDIEIRDLAKKKTP